ncbi:unnamed protein product [Eruca vesicaria subsp. sativa]|uniref:Uncharacterized protein n=1 Tax=Eruca vesicaria subsp. sativa TaxID=29727 RepID=A0ABC8JUS2_ERUVS|nr:unnamed protein product [Eruca vesicaria subsp. sativa]
MNTIRKLLPKDDFLSLAIVEPRSTAIVPGIKEKEDFFLLTPRKTIAEVLETKQGSLQIHTGSSQQTESTNMIPAKRARTPIINLEDAFDQTSVTRQATTIRVKKEKNAKSV